MENYSKPENVKCPDCRGPMVSRVSRFGPFWSCLGFPKCRGTRDSNGMSKAERDRDREFDADYDRPYFNRYR